MDSETRNSNTNLNWLLGVALIGMGGIFLLNQLLPGFIGGMLWAAAFAVGGVAIYSYYMRNREHWWVLIPAYAAEVIAGIIFLGTLRFIPGEFVGAFIMFAIGLPFLYVYLRNREHWWALIPAYTMGTIGVLILLGSWLRGELVAAYINYAIALPFLYVYLRNREHWWALIPGGIMATIATAFLVAGMAYLVPVVLIAVGVYLLVRQAGGAKRAQTPVQAPPATPQYGPEADRPLPEFEPLGARSSNGPESDR